MKNTLKAKIIFNLKAVTEKSIPKKKVRLKQSRWSIFKEKKCKTSDKKYSSKR